jgi:4-hydroxy-tetrahydrodipicolinate synthase
MTVDERKRIWDITVDEVGSRVPVVPHISSTVWSDAVAMAKYAKDIGADGIMAVPPYYYRLNEREIETYYAGLAEASDLPVIVYNNPSTSKIDLTPEFLARLADHYPNTKWIVKDCSCDMARVARVNLLSEGRVRMFAGNDHLGLETFFMCYPKYMPSGWVNGSTHVVPRVVSEIYEAAESGDFEKAKSLYYKYHPLFMLIELTPRFPQTMKATAEEAGRFKAGPPRRPMISLTEEERKPIREILRRVGIV